MPRRSLIPPHSALRRRTTIARFIPLLACLGIAAADAAGPARQAFGKRHPFRSDELPQGKLKAGLDRLDPQEKERAMNWLHSFDFGAPDAAEHLRVDSGGGVFIVCPDEAACCGDPAHDATEEIDPAPAEEPPIAYAAVPVSSPPAYHSRPAASRKIYLDFNGATVSGTAWNSSAGVSTWNVKVWSQDTDATTFNDAEQTWMKRVWQRVAEDYAPFDVDVTTDVAYDPDNYTGNKDYVGWLLICETTDANGVALPHNGSGGVAYVGVFGNSTYSPTYQPAWVSSTNGGGSESIIAEAASHEMGHNMGLSHDATSTLSYYGGHGSGDTSWGPIMGTGYNRNVSQWSKGEYYDANQLQDDLQIISGRVAYRGDDHGGTAGTATPLQVSGGATISSTTPETDPSNASPANKGVIERNTDVDVFSFYTGAGAVQLNVKPWIQPAGTRGGNLDVLLELYDESGSLVTSNNAANLTTATISTSLGEGYYYLHVKNSGTGTPLVSPPSGYTSYGSIGQYFVSGTIVDAAAPPLLTGVTPASAFTDTLVTMDISGTGISTATDFKLTKAGQSDIGASSVAAAGSVLRCQFDLAGAATGAWSVVATNPDLETAVLADAFTVVGAIWTENFDGVVSGWTSDATTGSNSWSLSTAQSDSPTTSYFAPGPSSKSTTNLVSPVIPVPAGADNLQLSFRHFHNLQNSRDAGKLELSVNNGTWFDVTDSGSGAAFASYPYNGTISSRGSASSRNEFAGESAWTGNNGGFMETIVNLTDTAKFAGNDLRLRWRIATDGSSSSTGWYVDSISLTGDGNFGNQPPAIATAASSTSVETVTDPDSSIYQIIRGSSAALSVSASDDSGEPALTYTWALTSGPGAPVAFSANGSNASRETTATFQEAGDYLISVTVRDSEGLAVSSSVDLRVVQTASAIAVTPSVATLVVGGTQEFNAIELDQFGIDMAVQPSSFSWQTNGGGAISAAGLFSATSVGGPFTVTAGSGTISNTADVTVTPAAAGVLLGTLAQTYDGSPKPVSVTTTPPGLAVSVTYNGSTDAPVSAGTYEVVATVTDANYAGSETDTLVVSQAATEVSLGGLATTYDGTPKPVSVTTTPPGLAVSVTYNGSTDTPVSAGTYEVAATVTDANYEGSSTDTLVVSKAAAGVSFNGLATTYDGAPKPVSVTTTPPGLAVSITYNSSTEAPVNAGTYEVVATVNDANYAGSGNSPLVIAKAAAIVTLDGLEQTADGTPKIVTATTDPSGLAVVVTYDGSATPPTEAGSYAIVATVSDANHEGSASGTLDVAPGNDWVSWRELSFDETQIAAGLADEDADPDFDNLDNLAEYALGTNPLGFTPPFVATLDGTGLWFTFTRPAGLPDVSYAAESSDGFGTWSPAILEVIEMGETETVRAREPLSTGDPARRFLRLKFTKP
ncbi:MAG: hypothetical protein H7A48_08100 [Akkermansiaceae bacterium]|nr:hypothetical protein [Akkermansiaceae bacterium]